MLKKSFTLLFVLFALLSNAQFKQVKGTNGNVPDLSKVTLVNPPAGLLGKETATTSDQSFTPQSLQGSFLHSDFIKSFKVVQMGENGRPIAISGTNPKALRNASPTINAKEYLKAVKSAMQIDNPEDEFEVASTQTDELGINHIKMSQVFKGIPVYGAEIILHGKGNEIDFLNGRYEATPNLADVTPNLSAESSEQRAYSDVGEVQPVNFDKFGIFNLKQVSTQLVIYFYNNEPKLAYHHTLYKNLLERWEYFVDAKTGGVINKYESICRFHNHVSDKEGLTNEKSVNSEVNTVNFLSPLGDGPQTSSGTDLLGVNRSLNTYQVGSKFYMIDGSRPMFNSSASSMPNDPVGSIWTIDAFNTSPENNNFNYDHVVSTNNAWSSQTSVSAHFNGGKAYEYYKNIQARNSINGKGGNIVGLINIADNDGSSLGNAFWNGAAMFYGNGDSAFKPLARGLDVAGHEMTHGVVQESANLEYQGESGALNESFADIFGSLIDRDDWLIGEDVVKPAAFPSGALRSLSDPHNGAATGDFNSGWQPAKVSEKYSGSQDNGGVHINSGVPNHAYYLFANDAAVGKDKAEKVYYKALTQYLTKSSKFVDERVAVVKAATELYGDAVANKARAAFDAVGIMGDSGGNYETDVNVNPGQDFILFTQSNNSNIYVVTPNGDDIATNPPLYTGSIISKPSVSDKGDEIVFVGSDKLIHYINVTSWNVPVTKTSSILDFRDNQNNQIKWRNVVISKDGARIACITDDINNFIVVYDYSGSSLAANVYELTNPTYTPGISTGDVLFADAMEFDISGEYLMYDSKNEISSNTAGTIDWWDISFIQVWDKSAKNFAPADQISKLFNGLPDGVSVGNPTFSKNSPYIVAFDYLEGSDTYSVLGVNTETGDVGLIAENDDIGYPCYSKADDYVLFDISGGQSLNYVSIDNTKIQSLSNTEGTFSDGIRWGVWFSNGTRILSDVKDQDLSENLLSISPNPANNAIKFSLVSDHSCDGKVEIIDAKGSLIHTSKVKLNNGNNEINFNISDFNNGIYYLKLTTDNKTSSKSFIKM